MVVKAFINWKNYDKFGKLISEHEHQAHSFLKQYIQILITRLFDRVTISVNDTGGTARNCAYSVDWYVDCIAGVSTQGIQVGTGTDAVTINDYCLQTLIASGAGAGQLSYGAVTVDADVTIDGSNAYLQIYRTFTNSSGGSITVKEVGLVITDATWNIMVDRTLSENAIADEASATVTYKIQVSV